MVKKFLGSESIQRDEDDIICFDVGELDTNQELGTVLENPQLY